MRISKREAETIVFGMSMAFVLLSTSIAVAQAVGSNDSKSNVSAIAVTTTTVVDRDLMILARLEEDESRGVKKADVQAASVTIPPKVPMITVKYDGRRKPLEPEELKELLRGVGFRGESLKLAWGIVMRESRGGPTAHNGNSNTGDNSYGLFQINMIGSLGADRRDRYNLSSDEDLLNPVTNARVAFLMSGGGKDFGAWGVGENAYNGGKVGDLYSWVAKFPSN